MKTLDRKTINEIINKNLEKIPNVRSKNNIGENIMVQISNLDFKLFETSFQENLSNTINEYIENILKDNPKSYDRSLIYTILPQNPGQILITY